MRLVITQEHLDRWDQTPRDYFGGKPYFSPLFWDVLKNNRILYYPYYETFEGSGVTLKMPPALLDWINERPFKPITVTLQ